MVYYFRDALIPFVTDDTINSYVGLTNSGSSGGIAYKPGVCGPKENRTAVIRSYDDKTTGEVNYHYFLSMVVFMFCEYNHQNMCLCSNINLFNFRLFATSWGTTLACTMTSLIHTQTQRQSFVMLMVSVALIQMVLWITLSLFKSGPLAVLSASHNITMILYLWQEASAWPLLDLCHQVSCQYLWHFYKTWSSPLCVTRGLLCTARDDINEFLNFYK